MHKTWIKIEIYSLLLFSRIYNLNILTYIILKYWEREDSLVFSVDDCLYGTHKVFKLKTIKFEIIQKGGCIKKIV